MLFGRCWKVRELPLNSHSLDWARLIAWLSTHQISLATSFAETQREGEREKDRRRQRRRQRQGSLSNPWHSTLYNKHYSLYASAWPIRVSRHAKWAKGYTSPRINLSCVQGLNEVTRDIKDDVGWGWHVWDVLLSTARQKSRQCIFLCIGYSF